MCMADKSLHGGRGFEEVIFPPGPAGTRLRGSPLSVAFGAFYGLPLSYFSGLRSFLSVLLSL